MPDHDRGLAEQVHAIVTAAAPELGPKTWYGMPAYAKDGKLVCYFKPAAKFKMRYATLGFEDAANLDDGSIWPHGLRRHRDRQGRGEDDHRAGAESRQLTRAEADPRSTACSQPVDDTFSVVRIRSRAASSSPTTTTTEPSPISAARIPSRAVDQGVVGRSSRRPADPSTA